MFRKSGKVANRVPSHRRRELNGKPAHELPLHLFGIHSSHRPKERTMAQGSKSAYSGKQKRKAEHIAEGYSKRGVSKQEAKRRAWATVNKESGGGKKSGSGRGHAESHASSRKGGKSQSSAARSRAAKKGWETRRHGS